MNFFYSPLPLWSFSKFFRFHSDFGKHFHGLSLCAQESRQLSPDLLANSRWTCIEPEDSERIHRKAQWKFKVWKLFACEEEACKLLGYNALQWTDGNELTTRVWQRSVLGAHSILTRYLHNGNWLHSEAELDLWLNVSWQLFLRDHFEWLWKKTEVNARV